LLGCSACNLSIPFFSVPRPAFFRDRLLVIDAQIHGPMPGLAVHSMLRPVHVSAPSQGHISGAVPSRSGRSAPSRTTTILAQHFLALNCHVHKHLHGRHRVTSANRHYGTHTHARTHARTHTHTRTPSRLPPGYAACMPMDTCNAAAYLVHAEFLCGGAELGQHGEDAGARFAVRR
jgi:hypothetical protein